MRGHTAWDWEDYISMEHKAQSLQVVLTPSCSCVLQLVQSLPERFSWLHILAMEMRRNQEYKTLDFSLSLDL